MNLVIFARGALKISWKRQNVSVAINGHNLCVMLDLRVVCCIKNSFPLCFLLFLFLIIRHFRNSFSRLNHVKLLSNSWDGAKNNVSWEFSEKYTCIDKSFEGCFNSKSTHWISLLCKFVVHTRKTVVKPISIVYLTHERWSIQWT